MALRMAKSKVLVTGGAGFIGSNLVRALLERGDAVRVLDNFSTGNRATLHGLDVEVVEGELRSYERVHNAVRGTDVVFHLGALGSVPRSVQDPLTSSAVNVEGTLNVLLAARDEGVRRVVFSSSSSVYGTQSQLPVREDLAPNPISPYGVAKLAAERYCISFSRVYEQFESVVVRYFNVFGPGQSPLSQYAAVIPLFITAIAAGEPVTIHGDGEQRRDFTYVENVIEGTLLAADADRANGQVFNVAASSPATVNGLAESIGAILGREVTKVTAPRRPGDIRDSWADISAARAALDWEPAVDLEEGLRRTIAALGL
jgi:UDP-glucose 4-epimerase